MEKLTIGQEQLSNFKNGQSITLGARMGTLMINAVFSINKEGILPARFLSGFLPAAQLAETIVRETDGAVHPTVRIFIPEHLNRAANGISSDVAAPQLLRGTAVINQFAVGYPEVRFLLEKDEPMQDEAVAVLATIAQTIAHACSEDEIAKVKGNGKNRRGEHGQNGALLYAAQHPFGWSDLYHEAIFATRPPFTVINTLPPSERSYTAIRQKVLEQIKLSDHQDLICEGEHFDLTISMCGRPHYLLITDTNGAALEPTLDDLYSTNCGEILDVMKQRIKSEKEPGIRENLRRAKADFEKLLMSFARERKVDVFDAKFSELIGG